MEKQFNVIRVHSINDVGLVCFTFPTWDAARDYLDKIEPMERDDMAREDYWYEIEEA